jgi:hypothetical protein
MVMGPDTKPLGEMKTNEQIYQTQFATTIAGLLGLDYKVSEKKVGEEIKDVMDNQ